jgi:hypothetical protein
MYLLFGWSVCLQCGSPVLCVTKSLTTAGFTCPLKLGLAKLSSLHGRGWVTNQAIFSMTRNNVAGIWGFGFRGYLLLFVIVFFPIIFSKVSAYPGISKMFWNLSAPKFALPESTIRETLYPKYEVMTVLSVL